MTLSMTFDLSSSQPAKCRSNFEAISRYLAVIRSRLTVSRRIPCRIAVYVVTSFVHRPVYSARINIAKHWTPSRGRRAARTSRLSTGVWRSSSAVPRSPVRRRCHAPLQLYKLPLISWEPAAFHRSSLFSCSQVSLDADFSINRSTGLALLQVRLRQAANMHNRWNRRQSFATITCVSCAQECVISKTSGLNSTNNTSQSTQCFTFENSRRAENRSRRDRQAMRVRCTSVIDSNTDKPGLTHQRPSNY